MVYPLRVLKRGRILSVIVVYALLLVLQSFIPVLIQVKRTLLCKRTSKQFFVTKHVFKERQKLLTFSDHTLIIFLSSDSLLPLRRSFDRVQSISTYPSTATV